MNNIFQQRVIVSDIIGKDGSDSIHNQNLQIVATEMYKVKNDRSPFNCNRHF